MTALSEYQRLESTGIWHASADEQRRDVILTLGDATLTIVTVTGQPLSHWSLPAIERINPGEDPALYSPGAQSPEVLEVTDDDMIAALERVRRSVQRRQPRPGRLRWSLILGALVVLALGAAFWLPGAARRQAAAVLPEPVRHTIGQMLLTEVTRFTGSPCATQHGNAALVTLAARLAPDAPPEILIVPSGTRLAMTLPGGVIVLNKTLVEDFDTPEVVAGYILNELTRSKSHDPLLDLLESTGTSLTLRLLVTGRMESIDVAPYAGQMMLDVVPVEPSAALVAAFAKAEVSATPFARAVDPSGELTLGLIEADKLQPGQGTAVLDDTPWVALQAICGG